MPETPLSALLSKVLILQEQVNAVVAELRTMSDDTAAARRDPPADDVSAKRAKQSSVQTTFTLPKHRCEYLRSNLKWIPVSGDKTKFSWVFFIDQSFDSRVPSKLKFLSLFGDELLKRSKFIVKSSGTVLEYVVGVIDNQLEDTFTFELFYPHETVDSTTHVDWKYALSKAATWIYDTFRLPYRNQPQEQESLKKSLYRFVQCLLIDAGMIHVTSGTVFYLYPKVDENETEMRKSIVESLHRWIYYDYTVNGEWKLLPRMLIDAYSYDDRTACLSYDNAVYYIFEEFFSLYPNVFVEVGVLDVNKLMSKYGSNTFVHERLRDLQAKQDETAASLTFKRRELIAPLTKHPERYELYDVNTENIVALAVTNCDTSYANYYKLNINSRFSSVVILPITRNSQVLHFDHANPTSIKGMREALVQLAEKLAVTNLAGKQTADIMDVFRVCLLSDVLLLNEGGVCTTHRLSPKDSDEYSCRLVLALHKLRSSITTNLGWQHLYRMLQEPHVHLGSDVTVLEWGAKKHLETFFFSLYADEFDLRGVPSYDEELVRLKFKDTIVEERLNTLLKSKPKSCTFDTILCYPLVTYKCGEIKYYFFKRQDDFYFVYNNNMQNLYVKVLQQPVKYIVVDPLRAQLERKTFYDATAVAAKVLDSFDFECTEVPTLQELQVTLERFLLILRCFAYFFKPNGWRIMDDQEQPIPPPAMNNQNKALFLKALEKLLNLSADVEGAKAVWQQFVMKLVDKNFVKTLDGTEYSFVNYDIRFLLILFIAPNNGKVFDLTQLTEDILCRHSRDNYYTLRSLSKSSC